MSVAIISFTRRGAALAGRIAEALPDAIAYTIDRLSAEVGQPSCGSLSDWTAAHFAQDEGLIFVSAAGIAVRAIAPFVKDKFSDPAVVSVDELGRFAVPLLSGHVGGANELARSVAAVTGGEAVVSTATDVNDVFAVDVWAKSQNLVIDSRDMAKRVSAALLEGEQVGFTSDFPVVGELPQGLAARSDIKTGISVSIRTDKKYYVNELVLIPKVLVLGIGCKRNLPPEHVRQVVLELLEEHHLSVRAVALIASIDLKREDEGIRLLSEQLHVERRFYSAEELRQVPGNFTPSAFVSSVTGVDNVCERSAVLAAGGELILKKQARDGVTLAAALMPVHLTFSK